MLCTGTNASLNKPLINLIYMDFYNRILPITRPALS